MRGASVHVRNRGDNTPLFLAEKMGHAGNVALLKEAGAHLWETEEAKLVERQRLQGETGEGQKAD